MLESLGTLVYEPWIYVLVVLSVLLDVFLPVLPSGVLLVTAATAAAAGFTESGAAPGARLPETFFLILCAATASVLGDVAAFFLARRGGDRFAALVARSRRLSTAQSRLGRALRRGGGPLMVLARFAPAGRTVTSIAAGATRRGVHGFVIWSAVAGLAWAGYSVSLGYFGGRVLGVSWGGAAVSVAALCAAGAIAARLLRGHADGAPG
ncbi:MULTISPECIES: DedA family protein [unclassified Streptomyces]|uniref:DedA family protein n=1 Tax=unclassified Streptomyces TaxID=2593676 RepID=UPI0022B6982D|nr:MULTISPECIES: VTT domain-containing protein [unclassified Streptomyces]MCZ7414042.1 VTT domain-containing protein [Streptomyces sp. WMMC897]MCZ7431038.1 VTT domain-containing protein [Streptomyces sp. WMMC1477]